MRKRQKLLWEFTSDYEKTEASACVNVYVNVYKEQMRPQANRTDAFGFKYY